jgi:hypothetical protein
LIHRSGRRTLSVEHVHQSAAGQKTPKKLVETQSKADGSFALPVEDGSGGAVLYLIAKGVSPKLGAATDKAPPELYLRVRDPGDGERAQYFRLSFSIRPNRPRLSG